MRVDAAGNVGIGTVPTNKFHVTGNAAVGTPDVLIQKSTTAYGHIALLKQGIASWNLTAGNTLANAFELSFNAAAPYFTVDNGGNVGIGTSSTTGVRFSVDDGAIGLVSNWNSTHASGGYHRFQNSGTAIADLGTASQIISGGSTANFGLNVRTGALVLATAQAERMRIDNTGNVGIGVTPAARFHVQSSGSASSVGQTNISALTGSIRLIGSLATVAEDGISYTSGGGGGAAVTFSRDGAAGTALQFYTNATGNAVVGGMTQRMTIDNAGNVGVGTTSPSFPLDVNGLIGVGTKTAVSGLGGNIRYRKDTGASAWAAGVLGSAGETAFSIYDSVGSVERIRVNQGGTVSVTAGTTGAALSVSALSTAGSIGVTIGGAPAADSTPLQISGRGFTSNWAVDSSGSYFDFGGAQSWRVYTNGLQRFFISSNGNAQFNAATSGVALQIAGSNPLSLVGVAGTGSQVMSGSGTTTGIQYADFINTSGFLRWGVTGSVANTLFSGGSTAYSSCIGTQTGTDFVLGTNSVTRMILNSVGNVAISPPASGSTLTVNTATAGIAETWTDGSVTGALNFGSTQLNVGSTSNHSVAVLTNNTARLTVDTAGTVNIVAGSGKLTMNGGLTRFESAEQACPSGSTVFSVAHGGPRKPDITRAVWRCKTAEGNWAVGDELNAADNTTDVNRANQIFSNATNAGMQYVGASIVPAVRDKTTGSLFAMTPANWKFVVYCHWL